MKEKIIRKNSKSENEELTKDLMNQANPVISIYVDDLVL